jgi:hypothetical protein
LLAIHFPGGGLSLEGLTALEESFLSAGKTLVVQPFGSVPDGEEAGVLEAINSELVSGGSFAHAVHTHLKDKTDDQVWDAVQREVRAARFRRNRNEYTIGIACEARDLPGAKVVAGLIGGQGVPVQYPAFDVTASITEKLQALRATITQSKALLCYWAQAEGKGLKSVSNRMPASGILQGLVSGAAAGCARERTLKPDGRNGSAAEVAGG